MLQPLGACVNVLSFKFRSTDNEGALVPSADTLLQMWSEMEVQCNICCSASYCNFELLPPGNTWFTGTGNSVSCNLLVLVSSVLLLLKRLNSCACDLFIFTSKLQQIN